MKFKSLKIEMLSKSIVRVTIDKTTYNVLENRRMSDWTSDGMKHYSQYVNYAIMSDEYGVQGFTGEWALGNDMEYFEVPEEARAGFKMAFNMAEKLFLDNAPATPKSEKIEQQEEVA